MEIVLRPKSATQGHGANDNSARLSDNAAVLARARRSPDAQLFVSDSTTWSVNWVSTDTRGNDRPWHRSSLQPHAVKRNVLEVA